MKLPMAEARRFVTECRALIEADYERQRVDQIESYGRVLYPPEGLLVPCSRYGRDADDVAPWAILTAAVYADANGDEGWDVLEHCLSMVVNDSDGPAELLADYWFGFVQAVGRVLGITKADVKGLVNG